MKFNVGDHVRFLNEKGEGVIIGILSKTTVNVRITEGFDIPVSVSQLVTAHNLDFDPETLAQAMKEKKPPPKPRHPKPSVVAGQEIEIDLHIDELIESHAGMNNSQILDIQLRHFRAELDAAVNSRARKITFIHGVGTGRLKQEIYKILKTWEGIRFHDASYARYGFGATEVLLH